MRRKQVLALLLAVAMTANMSMPAFAAASAPVHGSIFWGSEETDTITEKDLAQALAAAVGTGQETEGAEKEETVYVFTDANGNQKSMTVSSWLKNTTGADKLYDNSILQKIENVKGDESFTQSGDILTWNAGGNDIYYQGTTEKAAPVTQKITYYLDEKEIAPADLAGKSGKVRIHIDYKNSEKYDEVFVPFTTMTGIIFSNDNVKNVEVDNGSVISEGKNTVVVGMAFPGLGDSLKGAKEDAEHLLDETEASQKSKDKLDELDIPDSVDITMDATDFKMSTCMTMVFSGLLDDDEDIDEEHDSFLKDMDEKIADLEKDGNDLADGAGELSDGINEAADGSNDLADGAGQLADGIREYTDGVSQVNDGASQISDGTQTLVDGLPTLTKGLKDYTDGVAQIDAGLGTMVDNLPDLTNGASTLSSGLTEFGGGVSELTGGLGTLKAGTQQLADQSQALNDGVAKLSEGAVKLQTGIKNYTGGVENLKAGTSEMLAEDKLPLLSATAKRVSDGLENYAGGVTETAKQIYNGADQITQNAPKVPEAAKAVNDAADSIQDFKKTAEGYESSLKNAESAIGKAEDKADEIAEIKKISEADREDAATDAEKAASDNVGRMSEEDVNVEIEADVRSEVLDLLEGYDLTDDQKNEIAERAASSAQKAANAKRESIASAANEKIYGAVVEAASQGAEKMAGVADDRIGSAQGAAADLQSALTDASTTIDGLKTDAKTVSSGIGAIGTSVGNLSGNVTALNDGLKQLSDGAGKLQEAAVKLETVSEDLKAGAKGVYEGIGVDNTSGVWGGVTGLQAGFEELIGEEGENEKNLNDGAARLVDGFQHKPVAKDDAPGLILGIAAYTAGVNDTNSGVQKLHNGALVLNGSMQDILIGTKKLDAGAKDLSAGASQLKSGTAQLAGNNKKLKEGAKTLADGASQLNDGMDQLASGTQTLANNSGKLTDGASQLSDGAAKLADGMSQISSGALELKDGCVKLNEEGVRKLADLYKTDVKSIDRRVSLLKDAAKSYKTFSGTANPEKTRVKFIYKTDSIEKNE